MYIAAIEDDSLPFLDLGSTDGVTRTYLEHLDDGHSVAVGIPGGFLFGIVIQTKVYVCY